MLISNLEDISISFLHVRAVCPVLLQLPQRRTVTAHGPIGTPDDRRLQKTRLTR